MKKLYTLLVLVFAFATSNAQIVNIPDAIFKARLLAASPTNTIAFDVLGNRIKIDINNDGNIQTSEALLVYKLQIGGYSSSLIQNLVGIQSFVNLQYLDCYDNALTSLDLTGLTNLAYLRCSYNQISALVLTGVDLLYELDCYSNLLTNLNLSGKNSLLRLYCGGNNLTNITITSPVITLLDCNHNSTLSSLDVSGLASLKNIYANDCALNSINLAGLVNLLRLYIYRNQLTEINTYGLQELNQFSCYDNYLTYLDVTTLPNLATLQCHNNNISLLDFSNCPIISSIKCNNNSLTYLNIRNGYNYESSFSSTLDFSLNPNLQFICADSFEVGNVQNRINEFGLTNCSTSSYCPYNQGGPHFLVNGNNRYDSDNNGCDVNDINVPNLRLNYSNGANFSGSIISNITGNYYLFLRSGSNLVTPILENSSYFNISPNPTSITLPSATTPYIQNFCLTANGTHNDLEVALLPIEPARPGFDAKYKIIYKNKGTQAQNGTLNLTFNDTVLDLVSSNPTTNSQATNSLTWNFSNLLSFETKEIEVVFNVNSPMETPAVNDGDILNYTATLTGAMDETPNDNSSTLNQTVVNSYDPNDKTCVEGTSITPSMVGQYVHYVIRFENTGTFPAENIAVKDIIDTTKFDITTLVPLSGSHPYLTRINNTNQVEFIFENINLPFEDASNDGYVAFKIKTKPTLVIGNSFSNSASIYFDYNFPIVTDTYTTTIQTLSNQDFEFNSVFSLSPVPTKDVLNITAKESLVMSSVSIYNTLGQLVQVNTNPNETIDISSLSSGSYFIKIISDRGSATGKFLKE